MKSLRKVLISASFAISALLAASANASFIGAELQARYLFPDAGSQFSNTETFTVVDPGVEVSFFPDGDPRTNLDFSATNLFVTYNSSSSWTTAAFNGFIVEDINNVLDDIVGVSLNAATNMAGLDLSRISFTADSFSVNWNGLAFNTSTVVSLDFQFGSQEVPEPAILWLFGLGLLGLVFSTKTARI
ncbi:MAG: PEP-CTERM sorting domain-containing protein [Porticoccaceae bacterium]|nr:PEP-CTERM sorting domain-containing protein [Pseudomonadales bacterium]MCP5171891.1 PEP-CTERM sorting domain-containing protein [Pseudomonadales bacterium]